MHLYWPKPSQCGQRPCKGRMQISLLPCLFEIVPSDSSIPSRMNSRHQAAEMQPVEGAQNLGFAEFKVAGPESSGGEDQSRQLQGLGAGLLLHLGRSPLGAVYLRQRLHCNDQQCHGLCNVSCSSVLLLHLQPPYLLRSPLPWGDNCWALPSLPPLL